MKYFWSDLIYKLVRFNKQDLIKRISANFLIKIIGILLVFINLGLITEFHGLHALGTFTLGVTIVEIARILSKFGMETSVLRLINEYDIKETREINTIILKVISICFVIGLLVSIALYYLAPQFFRLMQNESLLDYIQILSLVIIPFSFIFLFSSILQALDFTIEMMFLKTVLLQLLFIVLLLINNFLNYELNVLEVYCITILLGFIISSTLFVMKLYQKGIFLNVFDSKNKSISYKRIIRISFPMLLATSIFLIMGWTDILMLGYFEDDDTVGVFNASMKLATLSGISLIAVNSVVTHRFASLYVAKNLHKLKSLVQRSTKFIFYLSTPFFIIFLLLPKTLLNFWRPEFVIGSKVLIVLVIGKFFNALCGSVGFLMQMTNQQKLHQNIIILAAILNVFLNYFLIPIYSIVGAAIASTISLLFWNFLMVFSVKRNLGFWTFYLPFNKNKLK